MFLASVDHIWETLSVLTNLDDALGGMVCFWIWASGILVRKRANSGQCITFKAASHPTKCRRGVIQCHLTISSLHKLGQYLLKIVSRESFFCHHCDQHLILFIRCYYDWPYRILPHCGIVQIMSTLEPQAADNISSTQWIVKFPSWLYTRSIDHRELIGW